jgi:hypothetical protein
VLCYCGVNWVPQTCPELVETSTRTVYPRVGRPIEKVMVAVPVLFATPLKECVVVL